MDSVTLETSIPDRWKRFSEVICLAANNGHWTDRYPIHSEAEKHSLTSRVRGVRLLEPSVGDTASEIKEFVCHEAECADCANFLDNEEDNYYFTLFDFTVAISKITIGNLNEI